MWHPPTSCAFHHIAAASTAASIWMMSTCQGCFRQKCSGVYGLTLMAHTVDVNVADFSSFPLIQPSQRLESPDTGSRWMLPAGSPSTVVVEAEGLKNQAFLALFSHQLPTKRNFLHYPQLCLEGFEKTETEVHFSPKSPTSAHPPESSRSSAGCAATEQASPAREARDLGTEGRRTPSAPRARPAPQGLRAPEAAGARRPAWGSAHAPPLPSSRVRIPPPRAAIRRAFNIRGLWPRVTPLA